MNSLIEENSLSNTQKLANTKRNEESELATIETYAQKNNLTNKQVLELIEDGLLFARFNGKDIVVSKNCPPFLSNNSNDAEASSDPHVLPSVISSSVIDHGAKFKEDNRILQQVTRFSNTLELKLNEIIQHIQSQGQQPKSKAEIDDLRNQLSEKDQKINKLNQELEDLEILNRSLSWQVSQLQSLD